MKIYVTYFLMISALISCHIKEEEISNGVDEKGISDLASVTSDTNFKNPALIYGTTIGELVQQLYKLGKWTELLRLISNSSKSQYGEDAIINAFQKTEFGFQLKLKSMSHTPDGIIQLNYQTIKFGTVGVLRMDVVVENDTCRIIIKGVEPEILF
ncbi:MAG: hypothetical protein IPL74_02630 [Bacteroidetes bacterium]|nr:hypothetical protein [Bacteroidota bacterium]